MNQQENLVRELQSHADDIRHLQEDLREFKIDTNTKFEELRDEHVSLKDTLQGIQVMLSKLNDTLSTFGENFKPVYEDHLRSKHGPEWVKKVIEHYKLVGIILVGAVAIWKVDVILPILVKAFPQ